MRCFLPKIRKFCKKNRGEQGINSEAFLRWSDPLSDTGAEISGASFPSMIAVNEVHCEQQAGQQGPKLQLWTVQSILRRETSKVVAIRIKSNPSVVTYIPSNGYTSAARLHQLLLRRRIVTSY